MNEPAVLVIHRLKEVLASVLIGDDGALIVSDADELVGGVYPTLGDRVSMGFWQANESLPRIKLTLSGEERHNTARGYGGLMSTRLAVHIFAQTAYDSLLIKAEVVKALHQWYDDDTEPMVKSCEVETVTQLDQPEERFYRFTVDLLLQTLGTP